MNYKNTAFLMFFAFLFGSTSLSLAMESNKKQMIVFTGSTGVNKFFDTFPQQNINSQTLNSRRQAIAKQRIQDTPSIEERAKCLYELGDISDINILRRELKKCGYDKKAWDKVNTLGAGPTPMMIAQKNKYHASSILLYNYNRSDDPFFQAIMFGNIDKIDEILNKNPEKLNKEIVIDNGQCSSLPLSWAITLEDKKLVKYFLEKGARTDIESSIGLRPFDEACNSPKILKLMAPYGGSKLQRHKDFFDAIGKDDVEKMKELVARNMQSKLDIMRKPSGFFTPLKWAVVRGNEKATQYLISNGTFNIPKKSKRELFLHACIYGKIPVIHLLLNEVNDITFYLKGPLNKDCPFNYCLSNEVKQELFALYKKDHHTASGQELLSLTTKLGHENLIQQTLNEGIDINGYDSEKMTALLWACSYGDPDSISFLIQHGANVNARDKKGRCGLRKLIRMHKTSPEKDGKQLTTSELLPCLLLLVCNGADKNSKDTRGESPLDWVKKQKFNKDEKQLINRVFNSDQLSRDGLVCLLNDIDAFQSKELEQAQKTGDEQAIYYIKRSLVKYPDIIFSQKINKKEYYQDLVHAQLKQQKK